MCDPKLLATADIASSVFSATNKTFGAVSASLGRRDAAKFREAQANENAEAAELAGEQKVRANAIATGRLFSKQRASFAANGIDIAGSQTALDVLADTSEEGMLEGKQLRDNAAKESRAFRTEAAFARSEKKSESPFLSGATAALGGFSKVASKWYAHKKAGTI